jgi:hypothetical protein
MSFRPCPLAIRAGRPPLETSQSLSPALDWGDRWRNIHVVVSLGTTISISSTFENPIGWLTLIVAEGPLNDSDSITSG